MNLVWSLIPNMGILFSSAQSGRPTSIFHFKGYRLLQSSTQIDKGKNGKTTIIDGELRWINSQHYFLWMNQSLWAHKSYLTWQRGKPDVVLWAQSPSRDLTKSQLPLQTTSAVAIKCQTPSGTPLLEFYTAIAQPTIEAENTAQGGGDTDEW